MTDFHKVSLQENAMDKFYKSHFYFIFFTLLSTIFIPLYYNYLIIIYIIYNQC